MASKLKTRNEQRKDNWGKLNHITNKKRQKITYLPGLVLNKTRQHDTD